MKRAEFLKRIVKIHELDPLMRLEMTEHSVEGMPLPAPSSLDGHASPMVVDKQRTHRLNGVHEEFSMIGLGVEFTSSHHPDQRLMDEGTRLECMTGLLSPHHQHGDSVQLVIKDSHASFTGFRC